MGRLWTTRNGKRVRTKEGYKREYELYQSSPKAKQERAARNNARRSALRKGLVQKGDSKEVHHKNGTPTDNSGDNLAVISRQRNRGKREKSRKRGSKRSRYGN